MFESEGTRAKALSLSCCKKTKRNSVDRVREGRLELVLNGVSDLNWFTFLKD